MFKFNALIKIATVLATTCVGATLLVSAASYAQQNEASTMDSSTENVTANESTSSKSICVLQGLVRRVEVVYEIPGENLPCAVNYYKDSEAPGEVNTLWSAQNIDGYCEEKAGNFVGKLESWGWICNEK
jgi:hypothetical protein